MKFLAPEFQAYRSRDRGQAEKAPLHPPRHAVAEPDGIDGEGALGPKAAEVERISPRTATFRWFGARFARYVQ
jgi:hypothetical protein